MDKQTPRMWEQLHNESDKAYNAFFAYLQMPIRDKANPENERTYLNLSRKLGYATSNNKPATTIEDWASKFKWRDRARAYDMYMQNTALTVIETELAGFQRNVIETRTTQITAANVVIDRTLGRMLEALEDKDAKPLDPLDIQRLVGAMKTVDDLSRRIGKMPTTYTTETVDEPDDDTKTYLIGG